MNSSQDNLRKILDDQKNITEIAINYWNIKIIEEYYDSTFIDKIYETSKQTARNAYDSLHFEENKKNIRESMPEVATYSLEKSINQNFKEINISNVIKISKLALDAILIRIKTGRIFKDKGVDDIEDINNIKICGYYMSAHFAKDFCNDNNTYKYLQNKSIEAYKELKDENSRKALLDYVDKEFLNVK